MVKWRVVEGAVSTLLPRSPGSLRAKCAATISSHAHRIIATIRHRLTNTRVEALNTTLRLIVRRAYGFRTARAMIALAILKLGGYRPELPNTARPT